MDASTLEINKKSFKLIDHIHTLMPPSELGIEGPLRPDMSLSIPTQPNEPAKRTGILEWVGLAQHFQSGRPVALPHLLIVRFIKGIQFEPHLTLCSEIPTSNTHIHQPRYFRWLVHREFCGACSAHR